MAMSCKVLLTGLLLAICGLRPSGSERGVAWVPTLQISPYKDTFITTKVSRLSWLKGPITSTRTVMAATLDDSYRDVKTERMKSTFARRVQQAVQKSESLIRLLRRSARPEKEDEEMYCNLPGEDPCVEEILAAQLQSKIDCS
jgi:hypothetical protein